MIRFFPSPNLARSECAIVAVDGDSGITTMANVIRLSALRGAIKLGVDVSHLYERPDCGRTIKPFTSDAQPCLLHAV